MATAPDRPQLRARFERKRDAVIADACHLFAERGYDGTAIEDIGAATGLAVGGVYHYIGSKENLLSEIFRQLMDPLLEQAQRIEAEPGPAGDRLRQLIHVWVAHVAEHREHMLVFGQERHLLERDPERWEEIRTSRRRFEDILARMLEAAAMELGAAPDDDDGGGGDAPDLQILQLALLGMVNHTAQWLRLPGRLDPPEIADGYWSIAHAALHSRRAPVPDPPAHGARSNRIS